MSHLHEFLCHANYWKSSSTSINSSSNSVRLSTALALWGWCYSCQDPILTLISHVTFLSIIDKSWRSTWETSIDDPNFGTESRTQRKWWDRISENCTTPTLEVCIGNIWNCWATIFSYNWTAKFDKAKILFSFAVSECRPANLPTCLSSTFFVHF